jgi:hypothetical protein
MTSTTQESQAEVSNDQQSVKEINFRKQEAMYLRQVEQERNEKEKLKQELESLRRQPQQTQEDDDESEPYVDHKKLNKKLSSFGQTTQSEIQKAMETAKQAAKEELKQEMF